MGQIEMVCSQLCRGGNTIGMKGGNWMNVQSEIETEGRNQGLTPDERQAIRHIFDCEDDISIVPEQFSDVLCSKGPIK